MFRKTELARCALVALGALAALPAAQAQDTQLERVEITGSAIRRIDAEGSLPVTTIRRDQIERTGATSITDLMQKLPGIQGGTTEASSVGGGGGGFSGVSLHNLGETRTLVLLNGRRLAQFGGQTLTGFAAATDLNSIPVAAIERIEVLTDGASALYGSDAVSGVVNFITRRNSEVGDVTVGGSFPKDGAEERRISVTKGFGDLETNGFNALFSIGYDKRRPLNAPDRSVSKSGVVNFDYQGRRYQAFLGSASSIPANVSDDDGDLINPYFLANGNCASGSVAVTDPGTGKTACYFDFVQQLEIYPERERKTAMASFTVKLGDNHRANVDLFYAKNESTGIIAPVPGGVAIDAGTPLHDQYLAPLGVTGDSVAFYRVADLGKRADLNESTFRNFVVGLEGVVGAWDYKTGITHSESDYSNSISGYPGALALNRLLTGGLLNPFLLPGEQSPAAQDALSSIAYRGYWDGGKSELSTFDFSASRELMKLPGGAMAIGAGVNYYKEKFGNSPSLFAQGLLADPVAGTACDPDSADPALACDQRFGDSAAIVPYSADRDVYGVFAELVAPVTKSLEVTGAVRYDDYEDVGSTTNGKASFRWTPATGVLFRGSVGSGFKAPSVPQIRAAQQSYGVTSANYDCTPDLQAIAESLGAECRPGTQQYDVLAGGNADLKPEKSRQASLGMVLEPTPNLSVGADIWYVKIRDAFGQIAEDEAFANPNAYPGSWGTQTDVGTGRTYLAYNQTNLNLGKQYSTGIDFNILGRLKTDAGDLTTQLLATYMLREDQQLVPDGEYYSAIGNNNPSLGVVTFRWQGRLTTALRTGNWQHALTANFKSGYKDAAAEVELLDEDDNPTGEFETITRRIGTYVSFDWQTQWNVLKQLQLTGGILNIFDRDPPLSLANGGNGKGQMFGYDDRYYDVRGRTLYLNASYKF